MGQCARGSARQLSKCLRKEMSLGEPTEEVPESSLAHRSANKPFLLGSRLPLELQILQQRYRGSSRTEMGLFLLFFLWRNLLIIHRGCRSESASSPHTVRGMPAWAGEEPRLRQIQGASAAENGRMWALRGKNSRNEPDCRVQIKCIYSRSQCVLEDTKCQVFESAEAAQSDSKPV